MPRLFLYFLTSLLLFASYGFGQSANNYLNNANLPNSSAPAPEMLVRTSGIGISGGGASVATRDDGVISAGGTVVVGAALSDGLILAADSRLTVTFPLGVEPRYKVVSDSSNKLFAIGRVGVAVFGEAFILDRSIQSFVEEYQGKAAKGDDVHETAKGFTQYFAKYYDQHVAAKKAAPVLGFLFAGYDKSGIGRLVEVDFPVPRTPTDLSQDTHANQGLVWRGQTDVIRRLIKGYDPSITELSPLQKLAVPDQQQFVKELGNIEYYIPYNFINLQDGIDLSLALVQATVDMQRFAFGTYGHPGDIPGVGGSVDVLTIGPTEINWVKRKTLVSQK